MKLNKKILRKELIPLLLLIIITGCEIEYRNSDEKIVETVDKKEWNEVVDLKGRWNFSIGDDKDWCKPKYNDNKWEVISVPSSWENEGFHGYDGYAWYRRTFEIPSNHNDKNLFLHIGYIDDCDEVYINGNLVGTSGSFPPFYRTAYNAYRKYYLPSEFLKEGENTIAVRVYDSQLEGGILAGDIGIYTSKKSVGLNLVLEGAWKFSIGDNINWKEKDYNDTDWEKIIVPGFWEDQGIYDYDGYVWYRKEFEVTKEMQNKSLVLLLGKIDDFDEAFVNGVSVGSTGYINNPHNHEMEDFYTTSRSYTVPAELIKPGEKNVIAIRVYDGFINGGIYEGPIGIITQENLTRFWRSREEP